MKNEAQFKQDTMLRIAPYFNIEKEVQGTHFSGQRFRLDWIITPKQSYLWKTPDVAFGVEFKDGAALDGAKDSTKWLAQCVDYAHVNWDNRGYLFILMCPGFYDVGISEFLSDSQFDFTSHLMGQLGIGELKIIPHYGWSIILQQKHRIWSELGGVRSGKTWSCKRSFGSR
jgi:hypothetical protein